jgi:hypothetical protein
VLLTDCASGLVIETTLPSAGMRHLLAPLTAFALLAAVLVAGCGGGGGTTSTVTTTVTTAAPAPVQELALARRDPEAVRRPEAGDHRSPVDCRPVKGGEVKTIPLRSVSAGCFEVAPRDRLLFVNSGVDSRHEEPNQVHVSLGGWEATVGVGESALFPRMISDYLGIGLHSVYTNATVQRPSILVLPEGCAVKDPKAGESLCFAAGAPPCRSSELAIHAARNGAAGGTSYQSFLLVNRSGRTCTIAGFPKVTPIDAAGRPLDPPFPTSAHTTVIDSGNHPRKIALEPGAAATFEINTGSAADHPRSACHPRKAPTLEVTIPGPGGTPLPLVYGQEVCAGGGNVSVGRIE